MLTTLLEPLTVPSKCCLMQQNTHDHDRNLDYLSTLDQTLRSLRSLAITYTALPPVTGKVFEAPKPITMSSTVRHDVPPREAVLL